MPAPQRHRSGTPPASRPEYHPRMPHTDTQQAQGLPSKGLPSGVPDAPSAPVPVLVRMRADDNVAIVGNEGGLPAGTVLPGGLVLRDRVPQAHKVALQ
ncbi:MAG: hypothetical protein RLZ83_2060, partial [Pseudomonadota bacterium]